MLYNIFNKLLKRSKMLILLCGVILFLTCGCSNNTKELEEKIKELENKVEKLETNKSIITKEELVGVWEGYYGEGLTKILTFNDDGSLLISTADNVLYFAYDIIGNNILYCSSNTYITSCLNPNFSRKIINLGYKDNNPIIVDISNSSIVSIVYTKKQ